VKCIVAGNYDEYLLWQREHRDEESVYVNDIWCLYGRHHLEPIFYGTYYLRKDIVDITEYLEFNNYQKAIEK
jgi:hypothetical protein